MHYVHENKGTCSTKVEFDVEDGRLHNVVFTNGCAGNLLAMGKLLEGVKVEEAIDKLHDVKCGSRPTSCAAQLVEGLRETL